MSKKPSKYMTCLCLNECGILVKCKKPLDIGPYVGWAFPYPLLTQAHFRTQPIQTMKLSV